MARVGEGDPRWIVRDRQDGNNVNQWHWDQKDRTEISHQLLKTIFRDRQLHEAGAFRITSTELSNFDGDVTIANRKGKLRCFFDVKLTIKWRATSLRDEKILTEGNFVVNDCDSQNYLEDFKIIVTSEEKSGDLVETIIEAARRHATEELRKTIRSFIDEDLMKGAGPSHKKKTTLNENSSPTSSGKKSIIHPSSSSIKTTQIWCARKRDIYECFTLANKITAFTRAPCQVDPTTGGKFKMLNEFILGEFIELQKDSLIKMRWRLSNWDDSEGADSIVSMKFGGEDGKVDLAFEHSGIPADKLEQVKAGWEANFWGPMKNILGYSRG